MVVSGCTSRSGTEEPANTATAAATENDFNEIENKLDAAGWPTESEFDWSELTSAKQQAPEVRAALPRMGSWVEASIFSEEANHAKSTLELLHGVQEQVDLREYDNLVEQYENGEGEGLENAAAYGLVLSPEVDIFGEPRLAVSADVKQPDDDDSAAIVDMTARAAIPISDGSINRWGIYIYKLEFTVPTGYESTGDWWAGTKVSTKSPGLMTCDWTKNYSAGVANDGTYDKSSVLEAIEIASPDDTVSWSELNDKLSSGKPPEGACVS